jgi:hypothetical protein
MDAASPQDAEEPQGSWNNLAFEWLRHCAARVYEQPQYFRTTHFDSRHFQMVPVPVALLRALVSNETPPTGGPAPPRAAA